MNNIVHDMVVVDASIALKWVLLEKDSNVSMSLLDKWTRERKRIIAPALFVYEVTNIIYREALTGKLTYDEADKGLTKMFSLGILLKFSLYEEISTQAMKFAQRFYLPAAYDAHYLALAQSESCEYWTADTRLWNAIKGKLDWVHWFGEYRP
ncbi:MAG TPA: type II toxin-antitoxin system VapC family toxin [Ktedonobacteraceae bacterium]|nr:type II toxin-antitoxin system VapC family toxin [Ktedonobacteraceae bacterium]